MEKVQLKDVNFDALRTDKEYKQTIIGLIIDEAATKKDRPLREMLGNMSQKNQMFATMSQGKNRLTLEKKDLIRMHC